MTREEAIEVLNNTAFFGRVQDDIDNAIDMATHALKSEQTNGDLISREAVLGILYDNLGEGWRDVDGDYVEGKICKDVIDDIKKLPTYSAEQTNGDLITVLSKLHTIELSDGQDYVQMYDVLETVKRYSEKKTAKWIDKGFLSCRCSGCGCKSNKESKFCPNCGSRMKEE